MTDLTQPLPNLTLEAFSRLPYVSSFVKVDSKGQLVRYELRKAADGKVWTCRYILSVAP